jgi:hypothetical protein
MADPVFKKDKVYQKFNLKELFGVDLSKTPELRQAIGQAIIEKILKRTADGEWRPGSRPSSKAGSYSESYANSIAFKAAGKSKGKVDMKLFGDMLGTLDIIDETSNTIEIGWDDELQAAKAYNHNVGDTLPKRPFFGLSPKEIAEIKRTFSSDVKAAVKELKTNGRDAYTEFAMDLLRKVQGEDDGED